MTRVSLAVACCSVYERFGLSHLPQLLKVSNITVEILNMSTSPSSPTKPNEIAADLLAAAALKRAQTSSASDTLTSTQEYEKRQNFRRLIDPGILRPNAKDTATASLKVHMQPIQTSQT